MGSGTEIVPLLRKKAAFDVLCASPACVSARMLAECGYRTGNLFGISFADGAGPAEFPGKHSGWLAIDIASVSGDYSAEGTGKDRRYVPCGETCGRTPEDPPVIGFSSIPGLESRLDSLCGAIKDAYGENVIAMDLRSPGWVMDGDGNVAYCGDGNDVDRTEAADRCLLGFIGRLGCLCIRTPADIIGFRGRYVPEFMAYAGTCLDAAVEKGKDARRTMTEAGSEIEDTMDSIRGRNYIPDQAAIRRSDRQWQASRRKKDVDKVLDAVISRTKSAACREARGELELRAGIICRDRRDGKADIKRAARWLRRSAASGNPDAPGELLDTLWAEGSDDSLLEMVSLARSMSDRDRKAMLYIGRAYRDGKGLPKSRDNAAKWLSKAAEGLETAETELKELEEAEE